MREYELVVLISPEVTDEDAPATVNRVQQFILERGGEVVQTDYWGRRNLAYPISSFQEASYVLTQFRLAPARVQELENSLHLSEDVIRHLVVKLGE
ncbi:MAG: 30S ribosomal protein S6 [Chloroflexi bacterium]|nr:30S ribosomal protein S6 [Chloroflexota bacterium]